MLRLPPQNIAHATSCSHYNAVAASTRKLAPIYAQNNTRTADDKSHAAIPMRSATGDSKTPYNYAHTSTPKAASSHRYTAAKKTTNRPQPQPSHTRGTFHRRLQPLDTENTRFRAPASSPKHSPCNIMQPLQCGSQHQLANLHLSTHRTRPEQQMTRVMQPFQCDLQPEIPKHPITTHTKAHPKQLQATVTLRQKNDKPTAAATVAHMRYLSSSPAATLHGQTQGFVLRLPPQLTTCLRHRFPSSPLPIVTTSLRHHFPSSPLPIVTTSQRHHLPSSTSLPHHFPSSPLPFIITSLRHHLPSSTSLPHHFPSSPLPFLTTPLHRHFPSSPLPIVPTSLPHHFPSSPLPFVTTFLRHHPSLSPPFIKINSTASYSFVMYCYVLYCYVIYHPSSFQVSEFYLSVTRKYCFPTSFDYSK